MRALHRGAHFRVEHDSRQRVVRVVRLDTRIESIQDFDGAYSGVIRALDSLKRSTHAVVLDIRAGAMRNDPVFERAIERYRKDLTRDFAKVCVIVSTALGQVQVQRHARADGRHYDVFTCPDEAMRVARSPRSQP